VTEEEVTVTSRAKSPGGGTERQDKTRQDSEEGVKPLEEEGSPSVDGPKMMHFMLLFSRQGKLRLQKWNVAYSSKTQKKITRELITTILGRKPRMSSFLEWQDMKIVYKRYASLYFCCAVEPRDNELITLEIIHRYVELLDKYFGSVCELDIIFNFEKAYFILDELLVGGEIQETSKKSVLKAIAAQDMLQEESWDVIHEKDPTPEFNPQDIN
jgi:AP-1 complex subunit sigma 1/2